MVPNGVLANNAAINAKTSAFLEYVLSHQVCRMITVNCDPEVIALSPF